MKKIDRILLKLKNIPQHWGTTIQDLSVAKEDTVNKALPKLKKDVFIKLYVKGLPAYLFQNIYKDISINQIQGIDFIEYFKSSFDKERVEAETSKYTFIYNIGVEPALNLNFSKKLLLGLIEALKQNNQVGLFISPLNYSEFLKSYGIEFKNKISFPDYQEEEIF